MSSNSTVELIKIPAPKGYNAKHVWAIVKDGKQYGEIVPDMGKNGTIGYTVYTAAGVEHYSLMAGGPIHSRITLAAALSACKQAARNMVRWEEEAAEEAAAAEVAPAAPAAKFIIALCPATGIYLAGNLDIKGSVTPVKADALVFDTFEAAKEVIDSICGWRRSRVEQIAAPAAPASPAALKAFDPAAPTATKYAAESLCRFAVSRGCLITLAHNREGIIVEPTADVDEVLAALAEIGDVCTLTIKRPNPQSAMLSGLDNAGSAFVRPICEYDVCDDETVPDHTDAPLIEEWAEAFARRTYN